MLRRRGNLLDQVPVTHISPDPDDDKFIACAVAGKADFLVTDNKRHFPQSLPSDARIVNAAELLEVITLEL
jgi:predicted nucleic acid-binding protein